MRNFPISFKTFQTNFPTVNFLFQKQDIINQRRLVAHEKHRNNIISRRERHHGNTERHAGPHREQENPPAAPSRSASVQVPHLAEPGRQSNRENPQALTAAHPSNGQHLA